MGCDEPMWLTDEQWARMWDEFDRSAFRLETRPFYTMPGESESLARMAAGLPPQPGYNAGWHDRLRAYRAAGKSVGRVRTLTQPPTAYQRHQLDFVYPDSIGAGEDIRVVPHDSPVLRALPEQDFWLFDDTAVVLMHYREDGTQIGRRLLPAADAADWVRYRVVAEAGAVALSEVAAGNGTQAE